MPEDLSCSLVQSLYTAAARAHLDRARRLHLSSSATSKGMKKYQNTVFMHIMVLYAFFEKRFLTDIKFYPLDFLTEIHI